MGSPLIVIDAPRLVFDPRIVEHAEIDLRHREPGISGSTILRRNTHFTLKANPLKCADLDELARLYNPANRHDRRPMWSAEADAKSGTDPDGRWRVYDYAELAACDRASLDIFWLGDDSLADSDNLPPRAEIAREIIEDMEATLEQFRLIEADLTQGNDRGD